jgi:hypothetical protein
VYKAQYPSIEGLDHHLGNRRSSHKYGGDRKFLENKVRGILFLQILWFPESFLALVIFRIQEESRYLVKDRTEAKRDGSSSRWSSERRMCSLSMLCKVLVVIVRDSDSICEPRHPSRNHMIQIKGDGAVGNSFVAGYILVLRNWKKKSHLLLRTHCCLAGRNSTPTTPSFLSIF